MPDFNADKQALLGIMRRIHDVLELMTDEVPVDIRSQFRGVWQSEIKKRLEAVSQELKDMTETSGASSGNTHDSTYQRLQEAGCVNGLLELESDELERAGGKGLFGKLFNIINTILGSLRDIFPALAAVEEYKKLVEQRVENLSDVGRSKLTTLFNNRVP